MLSSHATHRSPRYAIFVIVFILAIAAIITLPNYISGRWLWQQPAKVATITQLRQLQQHGLSLVGWTTIEQGVGAIGGQKWSVQTLQPAAIASTELIGQKPVTLLLRPQTFYKDQPQVEWMDVNGVQQWTVDQRRCLTFSVEASATQTKANINARFFRGWNQQQTYAVLQWYGWAGGGHSSPSHWFWFDQWTQLQHRQRLPWVAVSLLIPIKPLGEIQSVESLAIELGQQVQSALMVDALTLLPSQSSN